MALDRDAVTGWLHRYIEAWERYDPAAIGDLFTEDAEYRYHPWDDPLVGREAIVADWLADRDAAGSWRASYEPYAVDADRAVAMGWSRYLNEDGSIEKEYRNIYLLEFGGDGRCSSFTEFFMKVPAEAS